MTGTILLTLAATVILTALVTFFVSRSILVSKHKVECAQYDSTISLLEQRLSDTRIHNEKSMALLSDSHEKAVAQLKVRKNLTGRPRKPSGTLRRAWIRISVQ